jgi:hypothetical protein
MKSTWSTEVVRKKRQKLTKPFMVRLPRPWQNGFAERLIGSIRRECVDHIIVLGEAHLRRILKSYTGYYNEIRTHRSLDKDASVSRRVQRTGIIVSHPILSGLHHHYVRVWVFRYTQVRTSAYPTRVGSVVSARERCSFLALLCANPAFESRLCPARTVRFRLILGTLRRFLPAAADTIKIGPCE